MKGIENVKQLRLNIPIGIKHALELLEKSNNNLDHAKELFKQEQIDVICDKINISRELANEYLSKNNYDVKQTISNIISDDSTLTERVLSKYKNKETVLKTIRDIIDIQSSQGLNNDKNSNKDTFSTIFAWIDYEEDEGFIYALGFDFDEVISKISNKLHYNDCADNLKQANLRKKEISKKQSSDDFYNDEKLIYFENTYKQHKDQLIEKLYQFVAKNVKHFP